MARPKKKRSKTKRRKPAKKRSSKANISLGRILTNKLFLGILLTAVIFAGAFFGMKHFFLNSKFFEVREITINKDRGYSFYEGEKKLNRLFNGRNIFKVDLGNCKRIIKNDYPQLRKVEVLRRLPDRLEVDIISRRPAAVLDANGGMVIDREAIVLSIGEEPEGLIKIRGINFFLNMPSRGERVENEALDKALILVDGLKHKMRESLREKIDFLSIADRNNIMISINGVKVKMGIDDFSNKIDKLNQILADPGVDFRDISYIDLRFGEAVIAPK